MGWNWKTNQEKYKKTKKKHLKKQGPNWIQKLNEIKCRKMILKKKSTLKSIKSKTNSN
jgi:hypothetical protein